MAARSTRRASEARLTEQVEHEVRDARSDAETSRHGDSQILHPAPHSEIHAHEDERDSPNAPHLTDEEYLARFEGLSQNNVLPDLPAISGYHTFWATTTNPRDSVPSRLSIGYELLKSSDFPGWEKLSLKTGDYAGCIGLNEMIAMKVPLRLYQLYMLRNHHHAPLQEEEKLKSTVQQHSENARRDKGRILDEDGYVDNVVQKASLPKFAA